MCLFIWAYAMNPLENIIVNMYLIMTSLFPFYISFMHFIVTGLRKSYHRCFQQKNDVCLVASFSKDI